MTDPSKPFFVQALDALKPLLEDKSILKIGHHFKYDLGLLARYGIVVTPCDDTILLSYALDGARFNSLGELADHWLGHAGIPITELIAYRLPLSVTANVRNGEAMESLLTAPGAEWVLVM